MTGPNTTPGDVSGLLLGLAEDLRETYDATDVSIEADSDHRVERDPDSDAYEVREVQDTSGHVQFVYREPDLPDPAGEDTQVLANLKHANQVLVDVQERYPEAAVSTFVSHDRAVVNVDFEGHR